MFFKVIAFYFKRNQKAAKMIQQMPKMSIQVKVMHWMRPQKKSPPGDRKVHPGVDYQKHDFVHNVLWIIYIP